MPPKAPVATISTAAITLRPGDTNIDNRDS